MLRTGRNRGINHGIAHRDGNEARERRLPQQGLEKNEKNGPIKPDKPIRINNMTLRTNLEQTW